MGDFQTLLERAKKSTKTIILPEGDDQRVITAALESAASGTARPLLVGTRDRIDNTAREMQVDISKIDIVDPALAPHTDELAEKLYLLRQHKGMSKEEALANIQDNLVFAAMMVREGHADGAVAGAVYPTASVVRSALQIVGKHPDFTAVSSFFIMLPNPEHKTLNRAMVFADCAITINPNAAELAEIAVVTGESTQQLLGLEPEIGMLSFSTAGSAQHKMVTKVQQATELAKQQRPDWRIIGEVQLDAAIIPDILRAKAPDFATEQPVNILVFPNLDAGNIGYKMCERFGGVQAVGPILQGLSRPVNDLSRGCSSADIAQMIAVTSVQSQFS